MGKLILLCGTPGSGKSTWIKNHLMPEGAVVSRDDIRFAKLGPGEDYFAHEKEVFKEFCDSIRYDLEVGGLPYVVADATHLSAGSRRKTINGVKSGFTDVICVVFHVSLETALERNAKRAGLSFVPEEQIKNMFKNFSFPNLEYEPQVTEVYHVDEDGEIIKKEIR